MSRPIVALLLIGAALAGCAQSIPREKYAAPWKKVAKGVEKSIADSERREGAEEEEHVPEKDGDGFRQQGTQVR
ncbi:MAG TPA: hypothetical protein VG406_09360 [Isosphaeraceae bacterium]|jgi:hypothetical protein|nr:hypothetical protein [Isosphaeraceae bacterium]